MAATTERSASPAPGFGLPRLIPSLPMGMLNSINPFAAADTPKQETKETTATTSTAAADNSFFKRPIFGAILSRPAATTADGRPTHERSESTVMFAEPLVTDSDDASREGSVSNEARRQKRCRNKPKTSFSICHPPPASLTRHKLHRRPRSLLQLHKLSSNARPVPAYEVIPSANFSARLTKSIIKTYKTKHGLCYNDMVVLRAEKYYTEDHEEEQASQDIVALICRGRNNEAAACGKAKISMSNGEDWEASAHSSGGYEFFTTDDHGLGITVRWVPKKSKDGKSKRRFNFSIIAAGTRRHPVIATLCETELDVFDTYKVPDPAVSTPLSTPVQSDNFLTQAMEDEDAPVNDECITDERLRSIIAVTSIYVAFKEGWSPYFKDDEKDAAKAAASPQKELLATPVNTPPGSPLQKGLDKRGSIRSVGSGLLRRSSLLSRTERNSTVSVDSIPSTDASAPAAKTGRARSDSASTVLVHRATSNRRRNNQGATWRPDLLNVQNSVPETSREDLTRSSRSPRLSTIASTPSPSSPVVATPRTSRKASIPKFEDTDDEGVSPTRQDEDKRESSATSDVASEARTSRPSKKPAPARKSRWRKLFCIS
ncbi:hypothetical protein AMS68_004230 [Peltaster fructicola]|uniref:Uncharacterized protein n=1 Tax=Peltaster fructicola TaxID=286661 RepID=A0A6H0XVE2_9PEZI|nr:hypothetical protein AMS68_004230 [Peltaster fructicola]